MIQLDSVEENILKVFHSAGKFPTEDVLMRSIIRRAENTNIDYVIACQMYYLDLVGVPECSNFKERLAYYRLMDSTENCD